MREVDGFVDGIVLLGVPAMVFVPWAVEGLKAMGLPSRWAIYAALGVAGIFVALAEAVDQWPQLLPLVRWLLGTLILGFAASGVYSEAKYRTRSG